MKKIKKEDVQQFAKKLSDGVSKVVSMSATAVKEQWTDLLRLLGLVEKKDTDPADPDEKQRTLYMRFSMKGWADPDAVRLCTQRRSFTIGNAPQFDLYLDPSVSSTGDIYCAVFFDKGINSFVFMLVNGGFSVPVKETDEPYLPGDWSLFVSGNREQTDLHNAIGIPVSKPGQIEHVRFNIADVYYFEAWACEGDADGFADSFAGVRNTADTVPTADTAVPVPEDPVPFAEVAPVPAQETDDIPDEVPPVPAATADIPDEVPSAPDAADDNPDDVPPAPDAADDVPTPGETVVPDAPSEPTVSDISFVPFFEEQPEGSDGAVTPDEIPPVVYAVPVSPEELATAVYPTPEPVIDIPAVVSAVTDDVPAEIPVPPPAPTPAADDPPAVSWIDAVAGFDVPPPPPPAPSKKNNDSMSDDALRMAINAALGQMAAANGSQNNNSSASSEGDDN